MSMLDVCYAEVVRLRGELHFSFTTVLGSLVTMLHLHPPSDPASLQHGSGLDGHRSAPKSKAALPLPMHCFAAPACAVFCSGDYLLFATISRS